MTDIDSHLIKYQLELGFLDWENINRITNFDLPLILDVTIIGQNLTRFLIDDGSSSNILYIDALEKLIIK